MKKENNNVWSLILGLISTVSVIFGVLSGFLYTYKTSAEEYAKAVEMIRETRAYQQVLREEVKANAEKKLNKTDFFQQYDKLLERVAYIERERLKR